MMAMKTMYKNNKNRQEVKRLLNLHQDLNKDLQQVVRALQSLHHHPLKVASPLHRRPTKGNIATTTMRKPSMLSKQQSHQSLLLKLHLNRK